MAHVGQKLAFALAGGLGRVAGHFKRLGVVDGLGHIDVGSNDAHRLPGFIFLQSTKAAHVVHTAIWPYDPEFAEKIIAC